MGRSVQSLLFDRSSWTTAKAKAWAESQGYRYGKVDVTDQYIRVRQSDPHGSRVKRTIPFGKGIRAVVAREESQSMATTKEARRRTRKKVSRKRPRRRKRAATVAKPARRRRRKARKVHARRRRSSLVMEARRAPRRRRRKTRRVRAWRGDSARHATAARKGHRRRRAKRAPVRRRRSRRAREVAAVAETPRRRRRRRSRRVRTNVVAARRTRRRHGRRRMRSVMRASRGGGMQMAEMAMALVSGGLGFVLADGLDRFLATYNPSTGTRPKDKFTSDGAGTLANTLNVAAKPSIIRIVSGVGATALPAMGAMYSRNPFVRASFEGMTVGAGVSLFKTLWNNLLMPLLTPKDTSPASLQKCVIARLYPAEVAAHINQAAAASGSSVPSGALSGPADVGPFALAGDSPYADAATALRRGSGVQAPDYAWGTGGDSPYPDAATAFRRAMGVSGDSPYADAAQALRREAGMGAPAGHGNPGTPGTGEPWSPGPPPGVGPGPQARPHADCGCIGEDNAFLGFVGDESTETPLFNTGN